MTGGLTFCQYIPEGTDFDLKGLEQKERDFEEIVKYIRLWQIQIKVLLE